MSLLSELKPNGGATKKPRRIGRGNGSNWGGTAGKGHKGQKARSGGKVPRGFEGGQTPIMRRLPKFGFTNNQFKKTYTILSLSDLNNLGDEVSPESLKSQGRLKHERVKVLANGKIEKSVTVKAHKVSQNAKAAIEAAGGKVEVI